MPVEKNGDVEFAGDAGGQGAGQGHAVFDGRPLQRDQRDDIGGPQPGMLARVSREVDPFRRHLRGAEHGLTHRHHRSRHGEDRAMMGPVGVHVQEMRAVHR